MGSRLNDITRYEALSIAPDILYAFSKNSLSLPPSTVVCMI